jgi:hypothetical protein
MSFQRLGEILPQTLEGMGLLPRLQEARVCRAWPAAAGAVSRQLAAGSAAVGLSGGVLRVRLHDASLAPALERHAPAIVRALNEAIGEAAVGRVVRVP